MGKVYVDNISKVFGKPDTKKYVEAVKNVTFEVHDGELVSLLGPSGCGKTTTLRIIAGLETPTSGRVYIDDEDVTDLPPAERDVGMVFQFAVTYDTMTVYENLAFPLRCKGLPTSEIKERVKSVAEIFHLQNFLNKKPKGLDVGTQQLIALARAFVKQPRVYLLDEPLTNVEPKNRVFLRSEIKRIQQQLKQKIIFVTHDQSEALSLSDKVGVMNYGVILQFDTPENLFIKPATTFVGYFLGELGMNLLDCTLTEKDNKAILDFGSFVYDVTDFVEEIRNQTSSNELTFGIRPENIKISDKREGKEWYAAKLLLTETLASSVVLTLGVGDRRIYVKTPRALSVFEENLWVNFPRSYIKIFDKATGKLLV